MDNVIWIVAIVCFTIYQIMALRSKPNLADQLTALKELKDDGVISQEEFDRKKTEILNRPWWNQSS